MELIGKKEFATTAFDLDNETFVIYIAFLASFDLGLKIYPFSRAQIAFLKTDKTPISIFSNYADFAGVFFKNLAAKLLEYIKIKNHAIDLIKG